MGLAKAVFQKMTSVLFIKSLILNCKRFVKSILEHVLQYGFESRNGNKQTLKKTKKQNKTGEYGSGSEVSEPMVKIPIGDPRVQHCL